MNWHWPLKLFQIERHLGEYDTERSARSPAPYYSRVGSSFEFRINGPGHRLGSGQTSRTSLRIDLFRRGVRSLTLHLGLLIPHFQAGRPASGPSSLTTCRPRVFSEHHDDNAPACSQCLGVHAQLGGTLMGIRSTCVCCRRQHSSRLLRKKLGNDRGSRP